MSPEELATAIAALEAQKRVKNTSLVEVKTVLFPQLIALGLSPSGPFAIATQAMAGTGSGPGGSFTEAELAAMGIPPEVAIYWQYQLGGHDNLYDAADAIRLLAGYRSDSNFAPDPNFWYVDRVKVLYRESFNSTDEQAANAMLYMPAVRQAVEGNLLAAVSDAQLAMMRPAGSVGASINEIHIPSAGSTGGNG
jgi:hypothetical protein